MPGNSSRGTNVADRADRALAAPSREIDPSIAASLATSIAEAAPRCAEWLREAVRPSALEARILVRMPSGQMRPIASAGHEPQLARRRSARRRAVLTTGVPCRIQVTRPPGSVLSIFPLASSGPPLGVAEVLLGEQPDDDQWRALQGSVEQVGVVLSAVRDREALQRRVHALSASAGLAAAMLEARTVQTCTRVAARYCHERFELPVACWSAKGDPGRLQFLGAYGLGARRRALVRRLMDPLPLLRVLSDEERARHLDGFREATGIDAVSLVDVGPALLLVAGDDVALEETLAVVETLLREAVRNLERVAAADQRDARVETGLAWTAHELRGPLRSVKAVIDLLLASTGPDQPLRDLLGRSSQELDDLAGQVDTLLGWAVGPARLRRRPRNVVDVVRRAVESCSLGAGLDRLTLTGAEEAVAVVDGAQLRSAVANLIRNALAYSSPHSPVDVRVRVSEDHVLVSVLDRGSGVGSSEEQRIFDPFVRGRASQSTAGAGLGLFIARRIVEAHGGSLWTEPANDGGAFHLALPRGSTASHDAVSSSNGPVLW